MLLPFRAPAEDFWRYVDETWAGRAAACRWWRVTCPKSIPCVPQMPGLGVPLGKALSATCGRRKQSHIYHHIPVLVVDCVCDIFLLMVLKINKGNNPLGGLRGMPRSPFVYGKNGFSGPNSWTSTCVELSKRSAPKAMQQLSILFLSTHKFKAFQAQSRG